MSCNNESIYDRCLHSGPQPRLDSKGCPTGITICVREQVPSGDATIANGVSEPRTIAPPDMGFAREFVTTAAVGDWLIDSVVIGSLTVVQGPVDAANYSTQYRRNQLVGWGIFKAQTPVYIRFTRVAAAAANPSPEFLLRYTSTEGGGMGDT